LWQSNKPGGIITLFYHIRLGSCGRTKTDHRHCPQKVRITENLSSSEIEKRVRSIVLKKLSRRKKTDITTRIKWLDFDGLFLLTFNLLDHRDLVHKPPSFCRELVDRQMTDYAFLHQAFGSDLSTQDMDGQGYF